MYMWIQTKDEVSGVSPFLVLAATCLASSVFVSKQIYSRSFRRRWDDPRKLLEGTANCIRYPEKARDQLTDESYLYIYTIEIQLMRDVDLRC